MTKKANVMSLLSLLFTLLLLASSCQEDEPVLPQDESDQAVLRTYLNISLEAIPNYANPVLPAHYGPNVLNTDNSSTLNPLTDNGALLGRVLFYDKQLSLNQTVSCASCHLQSNGFTDARVLSPGFAGGLTGKHSMRLANARFYAGRSMFWDKRARDLEDQVIQPIKDHVEMGFDAAGGGMPALVSRMKNLPYYPVLFRRAFGSEEITEDQLRRALAQFVRSIVSVNSKFDAGFSQVFNPATPGGGLGLPFPNFSPEENLGKQLFLQPLAPGVGSCASCHTPPTFSLTPTSLSNGINAGETVIFKSPSLKNAGLTGPYMHGGQLATLEEVIEHYNSGIQDGPALDPRLRMPPPPQTQQPPQPARLNLTAPQKAALVAFLHTLTDTDLITDARFSDPFIR
jgi:cytochrome c peroxidase